MVDYTHCKSVNGSETCAQVLANNTVNNTRETCICSVTFTLPTDFIVRLFTFDFQPSGHMQEWMAAWFCCYDAGRVVHGWMTDLGKPCQLHANQSSICLVQIVSFLQAPAYFVELIWSCLCQLSKMMFQTQDHTLRLFSRRVNEWSVTFTVHDYQLL